MDRRNDGDNNVWYHFHSNNVYVLLLVILLNLLIALMNATIGKTQDRKHLYWKFVRTCIWLEFFGEANALPPPFNLLAVARSAVKGVYVHAVERLRRKRAPLTVSLVLNRLETVRFYKQ